MSGPDWVTLAAIICALLCLYVLWQFRKSPGPTGYPMTTVGLLILSAVIAIVGFSHLFSAIKS